jgi:hypothetical protein
VSNINTSHATNPQGTIPSLIAFAAGETPAQLMSHREIARRYRRKRGTRGGPKTNVRICDLNCLFDDRYGAVLTDDDAGAEDAWIMANHLAHLPQPERRIRDFLRQRASWYTASGTDWLIEKVMRRPLKWTADKLGQRLRLTDADRTRLGITTIGGFDFLKAKRAQRRRKKKNDAKQLKRMKAGAKPHALSEARLKPWVERGWSESKYRRWKRQIASGDSNSGTAYPKDIMVETNHCQWTSAPPPKGGSVARAVPTLSDADAVFDTDATLSPRFFPTAARERDFYLRAASSM